MAQEHDFLTSLGPLSLTLRMRRLAERLSTQGKLVYDALEVELEPGWYALLLLLDAHQALSVSEAARKLGITHPSMVKTSSALERAGWIVSARDPADGRRRVMSLTSEARAAMHDFEQVWSAFEAALRDLDDGTAGSLEARLVQCDALLDERSLDARVLERLAHEKRTRRAERAQPEYVIRALEGEREERRAVVAMARQLVKSADTYAYDPDVSDEELWEYWHPVGSSGRGFVAVEPAGEELVGMFVIRPNHPGPASHVANASYAVRADWRGRGLGKFMGRSSLSLARQLGYEAMQFNIVVSTNTAAVELWRKLGFRIVGTVPGGFRLPGGARVSHHIMYRELTDDVTMPHTRDVLTQVS